MRYRCAILDDYQNVALKLADWSKLAGETEIKVFTEHMTTDDEVVRALQGFQIVCVMRERTPFTRAMIEQLPDLKLLCTTGPANASIDAAALHDRGVTFCHTGSTGDPTADLTFGLILELARRAGWENERIKAGAPQWQTRLGMNLEGKTLGVIGLGKLGSHVASIAKAFRMRVIAWSQNLTAEKCTAAGVEYAGKQELFRQSDFITIHMRLSPRSNGLVGAAELALMKPTAYIVNTSRGPLIDEAALVEALRARKIAGAGLDVFDVEPLPMDHPFRKLDNTVLTPHLGYVTEDVYRIFFGDTVENIRGFLDGKPVRVIRPA
jgi:phosphoglycerate dehydrogenase-like enzyme